MEYRRFENCLILRLDPGDEVCGKIMEVCRLEDVSLASVSGIGAGDSAEIGLYDIPSREFRGRVLSEPFEIVSVMGNVTRMNGEIYLHLHSTLADGASEKLPDLRNGRNRSPHLSRRGGPNV